jgi:hypothetical protein
MKSEYENSTNTKFMIWYVTEINVKSITIT